MRYQKTSISIWNDPQFTNLSPWEQRFYFYIATNPNTNLIGLYILKAGYVTDDLNCSRKNFKKWIDELSDIGLISYCKDTKLLFIRDYLRQNPFTNSNQQKAAHKLLSDIPKSSILDEFLQLYAKELTKDFKKDLPKPTVTDTAYKREDADTERVFKSSSD